MSFLSTALVLFAVFFGWGAGAAILVLPRRWRRHWPVFAPFAGCTLLAATVWAGVWLGLRGTDRYALPSCAIPAGLLALALWRAGAARWTLLFGALRKHVGVLGLAALAMGTVARPLDRAGYGLTALSLGSCDAADYAAGGRVFKEFARTDRTGFLGHTETVQLRSVDNFPDHWLRLNHFSPAALLAWNSSALGLKLHKLVTVLGVALLGAGVPLAFWAARALVRLNPAASLAVAAAWGFGAVNLYAVGQVALGQLLGAPALVALTWAGTRAWREGATWRGAARWLPLVALAVAAVLAGYHFAILFGAAPLAAWIGWQTLRTRDFARCGRVAAIGLGALALAAVLFAARVAGLAERFSLFAEFDFGWFIPVFTPERWFGWFGDAQLNGGAHGRLVGLVLPAAWGAWFWFHRRSARAAVALAWLVPVLLGYGWLAYEGVENQSNKVYDAYKLFALFHPLVLAALAAPLAWLSRRPVWGSRLALLGGLAWFALSFFGAAPLRAALQRPPLVADKPITGVQRAEEFAEVTAVNMNVEPFWARLWANAFLLRKAQYFPLYTYEGRRPGPLRADWDLRDRLITVLTGDDDSRILTDALYLLRLSLIHI